MYMYSTGDYSASKQVVTVASSIDSQAGRRILASQCPSLDSSKMLAAVALFIHLH